MTIPHYKGDLEKISNLPKTNNNDGDTYFIKSVKSYYIYEDTKWQSIKED